jgi:2-oxo-hept-3-ene-1,7-dioate hydratase
MLDEKTIDAIARGYLEVERTGKRARPPSVQYQGFTVDDAYAVQRRWVALKQAEGRTVKGHKIGLTSRAMQSVVGIDEPDYGALLDDMFFADGAEIPMKLFIEPRIECELAFIMGRTLKGPGCTIFDVLSATDYIMPAAEIIDSRTLATDPETKQPRSVLDSIAANAGNAALVTGGRPIKPMEVDLRWVSVLCYRNGVIEESGVAAAVMNHPANGIVWLVNKLAEHGEALAAGELVLAGSFTRTVNARAGDIFHIDYGPLGAITCRFV